MSKSEIKKYEKRINSTIFRINPTIFVFRFPQILLISCLFMCVKNIRMGLILLSYCNINFTNIIREMLINYVVFLFFFFQKKKKKKE